MTTSQHTISEFRYGHRSRIIDHSLCGPGKFMIETRAALKDLGVEDKRIHFELFSAGDPQ